MKKSTRNQKEIIDVFIKHFFILVKTVEVNCHEIYLVLYIFFAFITSNKSRYDLGIKNGNKALIKMNLLI